MKKSRQRNYRVDAATPNPNIKNTILSAVNNVKWINTEIKILAENGSIALITTIDSLNVKKLFNFFDLGDVDGTITRMYD